MNYASKNCHATNGPPKQVPRTICGNIFNIIATGGHLDQVWLPQIQLDGFPRSSVAPQVSPLPQMFHLKLFLQKRFMEFSKLFPSCISIIFIFQLFLIYFSLIFHLLLDFSLVSQVFLTCFLITPSSSYFSLMF